MSGAQQRLNRIVGQITPNDTNGSLLFNGPDPQGLLEYSVVYTDRALNHMSGSFQKVMTDISSSLKRAYGAEACVLIPGSGTYGMEAVARQFGTGKKCMVIRNGYFSFRWSQIFETCNLPSSSIVHKAQPVEGGRNPSFAPIPLAKIIASIKSERPSVVFAPHVETSAGMIIPDDYLMAVADAVHSVGGIFVLDCIASGAIFMKMDKLGVDVVISAPQKGWSGPSCCGIVMLSPLAVKVMKTSKAGSFCVNLQSWYNIMQTYENGGHAYYTTMPTDAICKFRDVIVESEMYGLDKVQAEQFEIGRRVRALCKKLGLKSVAAPGFEAPGVVVVYSPFADIGKRFAREGIQIATGVPLMCDNGTNKQHAGFQTFRLGLFGLDKLHNVTRSVDRLEEALTNILN